MPFQVSLDSTYIEFLRGRDDVTRCPACGVPLDPFAHGFPQKKVPKKYDISDCFEGFVLISPRVKNFLEQHCTSPVEYFETGGGYFVLRPKWSVFEDLWFEPKESEPWRMTGAEEFCMTCGRHNAFHATARGILKGQREVGEFDLFRTALEYGPKMQKSFSLIVGDGLVAAMKAEKFKGLAFYPY